jgi:SWI/SNF-related matrix-associated actin-dependent regulator 1 of chromatin subfamily A
MTDDLSLDALDDLAELDVADADALVRRACDDAMRRRDGGVASASATTASTTMSTETAVSARARATTAATAMTGATATTANERASPRATTANASAVVEFTLREPGDRFSATRAAGAACGTVVDAVVASTVGSARDATTKRWTFPASALREVMGKLQRAGLRTVPVEGMVVRCCEKRFDEEARGAEEAYRRGVPEALDAKMFDFQRQGVMYALRRGGRALIGDEMGLGKTVQACALLSCYRDEWPALILVPTSLREAWRNALQSWLEVEDSDIACVGAASEAWKLDEGKKFNVVPYSLVVKLKEKLREKRYRIIVADESHFLKDRRAQRTQAVIPLMKEGAKRVICLTGTPALSRPIELFTQLEALVPRVFCRLSDYGRRYCANGGPFGMFTGCTHADELHVMISKLCMVRRLKKDVLKDLPPKQRSQVYLTVEKSSMGEVYAVKSKLDKLRQTPGAGDELEEKRLLNELFLASAKAKKKAVCEYLETLLDGSDSKFIFFAHHGVLLDAVSEFMRKKKVKCIRIDGSTPASARGDLVNSFQRSDDVRAAILSIKAAGMGLTLTAASTVIFGEMVWTPGDLIQAEDRAHRIGQLSSVLVQYLHVKDTIDEIIWMTIRKKLDTLGAVLNGQTHGNHLETMSSEKSPKKRKRASAPVVDISQRTLLEMFSSQPTQKTRACEDEDDDTGEIVLQ